MHMRDSASDAELTNTCTRVAAANFHQQLTASPLVRLLTGFGFLVDDTTGEVVKKPQQLSVQIGQSVELGANTCVDRGSWRDTVIGDHCKASPRCSPGLSGCVRVVARIRISSFALRLDRRKRANMGARRARVLQHRQRARNSRVGRHCRWAVVV